MAFWGVGSGGFVCLVNESIAIFSSLSVSLKAKCLDENEVRRKKEKNEIFVGGLSIFSLFFFFFLFEKKKSYDGLKKNNVSMFKRLGHTTTSAK